ncbi:MAG TPA: GntR family transcriptional regulator [Clostridia bacterium]|nr:GntR family transcriptional regulator [Clostridia bacterium]
MEWSESFKPSCSLKDSVYDALKTQIILGRLQAGEQLNIAELAKNMGISSAPVREALSMLHQNGFVVLNPRKKATVSNVLTNDYNILMDLRQLLEPYAAKLSAKNIPDNELQGMRKKLEAVLKNPDDMYAYVDSDLSLHDMIFQYCGSVILADILRIIKEHSLRIRYCVEEMAEESKKSEFVVETTTEHLKILDALELGDSDGVYEAMGMHIKNFLLRSKRGGIIEQFLSNRHAE